MQALLKTPLVSLIFLLTVNGCTPEPPVQKANIHVDELLTRLENPKKGDIMVVGHRGCWQQAPENSLRAIQRCIDISVDVVEIDVRQTKDGVLVLLHDRTLDRTTSLTGALSDKTYSEITLGRLRMREGGVSEMMTSEKIPTLKEALNLAKNQILINLDVKEDIYNPVFKLLEATQTTHQVLLKMRSLRSTDGLLELPFMGITKFMPILGECDARAVRNNLVCADDLAKEISAFADLEPVAYEAVFTNLSFLLNGVDAVKLQNARLWVNTMGPKYAAGLSDRNALNDPDGNWGRLVELGADMIQTDQPEHLVEYLRTNGLH